MKAQSGFLPAFERMPTCHAFLQPGALRALNATVSPQGCRVLGRILLPSQERRRVLEAEHGLVVLDVVVAKKVADFFELLLV